MKRKLRPLLFTLGILLAGGGVYLFSWSVPVLRVKNPDSGLTRFFRIDPPELFFLTYRHSMYDAPVTEEFEAGADGISLKGVRTAHPGVMEYYGFDQVRDFHPREVTFAGPVVIKKGIREGQGLIINDRPLALEDLAEKGERVELSVQRIRVINYLLRWEP